jgi:hypothetical protein
MEKKKIDIKFKEDANIVTSDFWYDFFQGGYIKPEELLEDKELIKRLSEARELLLQFFVEADKNEIIEYL